MRASRGRISECWFFGGVDCYFLVVVLKEEAKGKKLDSGNLIKKLDYLLLSPPLSFFLYLVIEIETEGSREIKGGKKKNPQSSKDQLCMYSLHFKAEKNTIWCFSL